MVSFPFSAIVGQDRVKLALRLLAVDPNIGGVLVSGPRGTAKSTLARSLAHLSINGLQQLVTLPLGATEEMLTGTLDLQQALDDKQVKFAPGLLSRAHQGLLYVDEVNLLPDSLVDVLLDVAASGINYVERDGISHQHEAEFVLMGTMNPDEGELRPQLIDRFGLGVSLSANVSVEDRVTIVERRQAFDQNPQAFLQAYHKQQQALADQINQAQTILSTITLSHAQRVAIAKACVAANVDGLRADLVWNKAACAHAALLGHDEVTQQDIDAVAELVLWHRRQPQASPSDTSTNHSPQTDPSRLPPFQRPDNPSGQSSDQSSSQSSNQSPNASNQANAPIDNVPEVGQGASQDTSSNHPTQSPDQTQNADKAQGDWGKMPAPSTISTEWQPLSIDQEGFSIGSQSTSQNTASRGLQGLGQGRLTAHKGRQINWFASLVAGLQGPTQVRYRPSRGGNSLCHIILLDTSGSTLASQGHLLGKRIVAGLTQQAYLARQGVILIEFGNDRVHTSYTWRRAPKQVKPLLDAVSLGGGTPFLQALLYAQIGAQQWLKHSPSTKLLNYIITDGRVQMPKVEVSLQGKSCLIDIEQGAVKRGNGKQLAQWLGAQYQPLAMPNQHQTNSK